MASTGGSAPPIFANAAKFNGTNWVTWSGLIRIAADLRGVFGYLDGTIPNPSPPQNPITTTPAPTTAAGTTTTVQLPADTPWESTTPSTAEWRVRNAWTMGLLIYNTADPVGLGIRIDGSAADAWKSYTDTYQVTSEIALLNAEQDLRNVTFSDCQDFVDFISRLRTKWSNATALGAQISDLSFRTIILNALPRSWDPIVATLYTTQTSRDAINQLMTHWARISRDRTTNPQTSTSALQTTTGNSGRNRQRGQNSNLHCSNTNCNRRGHTIEDCYWPGGGKAGQFPASFGKRRGTTNVAASTTEQTSANSAASTAEQVFALVAHTPHDTNTPEVPPSSIHPSSSTSDMSNVRLFYNTVPLIFGTIEVGDVWKEDDGELTMSIPECHNVNTNVNGVITLLDSGASDHCFVDRSLFSKYQMFSPPRKGNSAGKDSTFTIEGTGTVEFTMIVEGVHSRIVLSDVLHTPHLRSNLVSVSKLVSKGMSVGFDGEMARVKKSGNTTVLTAVKKSGLYVVVTTDSSRPEAHISQSKRQAVAFDIWHRRLGHAGADTIKRMIKGNLVDGVEVVGPTEMKALCEDCIYGTHTTHPFPDSSSTETEALQRVYIDIWGPSPVQSAGGSKYFMLIVDGATSYRSVHFLSNKSADATLNVFKEFHRQAERQTGKTLRRVRVDMGREWFNASWDTYVKEHGIVLDFTTPYAHQQNGKAERSMRTLLDTARTMLADSGLPQKFWADAVHTAVYIRNFIPNARTPNVIPAESWTQQRQDISHLRPFGSVAYAHIPTEVSPSKLSPRSVKLVLVGYYDRTGYKLLDRSTGAAFKSRDVIFEESQPHYSTDPIVTYPNDDAGATPSRSSAIAPRPKHISSLHPGSTTAPTPTTPIPAVPPQPATVPQSHISPVPSDSEDEVSEAIIPGDDAPIAVRKPKREVKLSSRMKESLEYLNRPTASMVSAFTVDDSAVPATFKQAMLRPDLWMEPMLKELAVMKEKSVFRLVPRPRNKNVVKSRWVFANKFDENGNIVTRKARLVAKGFTQILGEDYDETYTSVARLESVRLVCAVAASLGLRLWQVDFVSAFLNSENSFEVYMEPPPGFDEGGDQVWLLLKTLYGTMQGAHDWAQTLERAYQGHGYYTSKADPQVRFKVVDNELTLTSTWTDDILGASSTELGENRAKEELGSSYEIKDLGTARFILGMKIEHNDTDGSITLSQRAYCERMLERFSMKEATPRRTPLPASVTLSIKDSPTTEEEIKDMQNVPYREALGSLMWLPVATRPDLSFAVNLLSRFANNPGRAHWNALKHTLAYVKATLDYGITYFHHSSLHPFGYVDSDYAGDVDARRSTEGHIFFVGGGPVSWTSKRQETVALSTVEAEYMAFTRATQQAIWLDKFMCEIGLKQERPTNVFGDNTGAIANTQNNKNHRRTKHIDVKHHFIKETALMGMVAFPYVCSAENLADILTKSLPKDAVTYSCEEMGLC